MQTAAMHKNSLLHLPLVVSRYVSYSFLEVERGKSEASEQKSAGLAQNEVGNSIPEVGNVIPSAT
jgi:hypothetical protein